MENSLENNEVSYIKLDDIIPNRFQPREVFDETALNELADSIRVHGVIQPIIVRQVGNKYEIIAGERRYKASALAGLTKIPAIIRNYDDKKSSIVAYVENSQRRNVSPIEEARTADRILKSNNMTQEQLASELGISQSALANRLRLLTLPIEVQEALMKNEISERHARSLLSVKDSMKQIELLDMVKANKMTVRELEGKIRDMYGNVNDNNIQFMRNQTVDNNVNSNFSYGQPIINTLENANPNNNSFGNNTVTNNASNVLSANNNSNDFLNFINNFDPSKYERNNLSSDNTEVVDNLYDSSKLGDNNVDSISSNYDTVASSSSMSNSINNSNNDFMRFLNNYNPPVENSPAPVGGFVSNFSSLNSTTNDFEQFINNYEPSSLNNEASLVDNVSNSGQLASDSNSFMNFLNNYDSNANISSPTPTSQPVINEVVSPTTSRFNVNRVQQPRYVEDDERYNDVTKVPMYNSLDAIIGELQNTINKIKNSKYKIDTDEINFDDIYQITIKIDKRDFL